MSNHKTKNSKEKETQKNKNPLREYAKYSSIAFQMLVIILAAVFGGMELDKIVKGIDFPVFTIVLSVVGVVFSIYYAIKDFINIK